MHLLSGEAPERAQQRQRQQRFVSIAPRCAARPSSERRGTLLPGQLHRYSTQLQKLQAGDQRQRVQMQRFRHGAAIRWRGNWRLVRTAGRGHGTPPGRGNQPRSGRYPTLFPSVRKRPQAVPQRHQDSKRVALLLRRHLDRRGSGRDGGRHRGGQLAGRVPESSRRDIALGWGMCSRQRRYGLVRARVHQ